LKDDRVYLIYIFECIERMERYTEGGSKFFSPIPKPRMQCSEIFTPCRNLLSIYPRHLRILILKWTVI